MNNLEQRWGRVLLVGGGYVMEVDGRTYRNKRGLRRWRGMVEEEEGCSTGESSGEGGRGIIGDEAME